MFIKVEQKMYNKMYLSAYNTIYRFGYDYFVQVFKN